MRDVAFNWLDMAMVRIYAKMFSIKLVDKLAPRIDRFKYPVHFGLVDTMSVYVVSHCPVIDESYSHEIALGRPESRAWHSSVKGPNVVLDSRSDLHCLS